MLLDLAYVGNRADDLLLIANYNQATPNNAAGTIPLQSRRPIPEFSRHHLRLQRRQVALRRLPGEVRVAAARGHDAADLADAVEGQGQRRAVAREPERQLPGAAGLPQPRRRVRHRRLPPAVQHHDQLRRGRCRSAAATAGARTSRRRSTRSSAGGSWPASTPSRRRAGDAHLHARRRRSRCRASSRTSAARTTTGRTSRAIRMRPRASSRSPTGSTRTAWWCRPIRASRSATRRATACAARTSGSFDLAATKQFAAGQRTSCEFRRRGVQPVQPHQLPPPNGNRSSGAFGTITSTYDPRQVQLGVKLLW